MYYASSIIRQLYNSMSQNVNSSKNQKITLQGVRLSYVNIFHKKNWDDGKEARYQCRILINAENKELLKKLDQIVKGMKALAGNPANFKGGLKKETQDTGDNKYWCINSGTKRKPQIVDENVVPITDEDIVYSGCYANVVVYAKLFNKSGWGVSWLLNGVQKIKDGDRLDGVDTDCGFQPVNPQEEKQDFAQFSGEVEFE